MIFILPFVEQNARYEACITALDTGVDQQARPADATLAALYDNAFRDNFSEFLCPSEANDLLEKTDAEPGRINYMMCNGDSPILYRRTDNVYRGLFGHISEGRSPKKLGSITDGTSNTMVISEGCLGPARMSRATAATNKGYVLGAIRANALTVANAHTNGTGDDRDAVYQTSATVGFNPGNCRSYASGRRFNDATDGNYIYDRQRGRGWTTGWAATIMFHAILPPNSPSCSRGTAVANAAQRHFFSAQSYHTGGVNVGFADGSVSFVSDTVNAGDSALPAVFSGKSNYGVWGGLSTISGNESVSL